MNDIERNKQVVSQLIEIVWRRGDIDRLPLFWTEDCVNHSDSAADNRGLHALRSYHEGFSRWFQDFDDIDIAIEQQVAEGDRVVTQILLSAMHRAKQRPVSLSTVRIDRFVGGRIAEHWSVADVAGLQAQLG